MFDDALTLPLTFDLLCEEGDRILELLRSRLRNPQQFTLRQIVDVFERSFETKIDQGTTNSLIFIAFPKRHSWYQSFDLFLGKGIHLEGQVECVQIAAQLTLEGGLSSLLLSSDKLSLVDDYNVFCEEEFFQEIRKSQVFRWLRNRMPTKCKLDIKTQNIEEFFESAMKFIPELIKAGIWKCEGPGCPIGHAPVPEATAPSGAAA